MEGPGRQANREIVIRMTGVHKHYALDGVQVHALRGIDLVVQPGEFVAIMGPSGSGKSTLMNILGCLDTPEEGRYWLNGADVVAMSEDGRAAVRNRTIGFVFQGFNLLPRTSALENVETPLIYAGVSKGDREKRAVAMLERVGLGDRMAHLPNQLSGGQQQRVAIARALVNQPALMLADEPTGNLDTATSAEIMDLLGNLNEQEKLTIVMITHEADVAKRAGRRMLLQDGRLEE